jgi:glutathione S-transferase
VYQLHIANKNYSSWSLRPWVLMSQLGIAFREQLIRFGEAPAWESFRRISPTGRVPCLLDGEQRVWDSLAITEYLAERHAGVWPSDSKARAWARSAAAEMHSSFGELRSRCSMTCGQRIRLHEISGALERDVARLAELWRDGLGRFGGPFLGGAHFTAADAFFAPVAFRIQTYGLTLDALAADYAARLLALPSMQRWYADALAERFREQSHEHETSAHGVVLEDHRAPAL